jgi:hypothetical protein
MDSEVQKTRGYLKSFGVSVTTYEDEMIKLIDRIGREDPGAVLSEAIRLTEELNRKLVEIINHIMGIEVELFREMVKRIAQPGR